MKQDGGRDEKERKLLNMKERKEETSGQKR